LPGIYFFKVASGSSTMAINMKQRFRLFRRGRGKYSSENTTTGKQKNLGTLNKQDAQRQTEP
jgi:hypothetical protein